MKIRMLTLSAGPQGVRTAGGVYDVPEAEAKWLIEAGAAQSAEPRVKEGTKAPVESADLPPKTPEAATLTPPPSPPGTGPTRRRGH